MDHELEEDSLAVSNSFCGTYDPRYDCTNSCDSTHVDCIRRRKTLPGSDTATTVGAFLKCFPGAPQQGEGFWPLPPLLCVTLGGEEVDADPGRMGGLRFS